MNTALMANRPNPYNRTTKLNPLSTMGNLIHEKLPSVALESQYHVKKGDIISIFGEGVRRRTNFAKKLTESLDIKNVKKIDLSKVNDPGFDIKLEHLKKEVCSSPCPERKHLEDRLVKALDAGAWFEKPVQALGLEERAKMQLILELSQAPDGVIINRPTAIRQFNRKLRAVQQVYRKATYLMTDTIWNFPLSNASDHTFEFVNGKPQETTMTL